MKFTPTPIHGAYIIDLETFGDERGFFGRAWCREEFAQHGLVSDIAQCNLSYSREKGTIRGLHYQIAPHQEAKLMRCIRGAIYDVIVDLRPDSPTYLQWTGVLLTAENRQSFYVPPGCAHGFQTQEDHTEVFYPVSTSYTPSAERGVRWDDPYFAISWPLPLSQISAKDSAIPDFKPL